MKKLKWKLQKIRYRISQFFRNLKRWIVYRMLTFDSEWRRVASVDDLCKFIDDYQDYLRREWKYAKTPDNISAIYDKWFEILNDHGIDMDKIYN